MIYIHRIYYKHFVTLKDIGNDIIAYYKSVA